MQYYLSIYIADCSRAEPYYEVYFIFDSLVDAEVYYNQFNGKEFFNEEELYDEFASIKYIIIIHVYHEGNIVSFIKGKYKTLDLENYHPDFWKLYESLHYKKST